MTAKSILAYLCNHAQGQSRTLALENHLRNEAMAAIFRNYR